MFIFQFFKNHTVYMSGIKKIDRSLPINYNFNPMEYNKNIDRRLSERSQLFSNNTKISTDTHLFDDNGSIGEGIGELTGQRFSKSQLEQGLPMRSYIRDDSRTRHTDDNDNDNDNDDDDNISMDDNNSVPINNMNAHTRLSLVSNMFSINFFNNFLANIKDNTNLILSPFSILNLFVILYLGSNSITEKELSDYFYFDSKNNVMNGLKYINGGLSNSGHFKIVNLVCVPKNKQINNNFTGMINGIGTILWINRMNINDEVKRLNNIISNTTCGLIKDVVKSEMFNRDDMVLINALYFHSKWKIPFNPKMSIDGPFYKGGDNCTVKYMRLNNTYNKYYSDEEYQIMEKNYIDPHFCMGFILPIDKHQKLGISYEQFEFYASQLADTKIENLTIPKFRHQSRYRIDGLFKKYGLVGIFNNPDLSGILKMGIASVDRIIHMAVIEIDESGTTAAAATTMDTYGVKGGSTNFIADHPFIYYIKHIHTGTILFIGEYHGL